jgi:hypothetical protein
VHEAVLERIDNLLWLLKEGKAFWNTSWDIFGPWHPFDGFVDKPPHHLLHIDIKVIIYRLLLFFLLFLFFLIAFKLMVDYELEFFLIVWFYLLLVVLS